MFVFVPVISALYACVLNSCGIQRAGTGINVVLAGHARDHADGDRPQRPGNNRDDREHPQGAGWQRSPHAAVLDFREINNETSAKIPVAAATMNASAVPWAKSASTNAML